MAKFRFFVDVGQNYLHAQYFGELTIGDVKDAVLDGNMLYPDIDCIVDFSEASLKNFGLAEIQRLAVFAMEHEPREINCAFVAPNNLEFGLSRMYATIADEDLPQNRAVFRSISEAKCWLVEQKGI